MTDHLQHALSALRLTMGKMEMALGLIDEAIVWTNDLYEVEWCNGVFDRMVDKIHISIIGTRLPDILSLEERGTDVPESAHPAVRVIERLQEQHGYFHMKTKAMQIELHAVPLQLPNQRPGAIITIRDVSDQRELEQTRLQSLALQAAADAIVITDAEGNVDWVNRAFVELTGYPADDIYGRKLTLLKSDQTPPHVYKAMWEAIASGKVWAGELINKRKDGQCYTKSRALPRFEIAKGVSRIILRSKGI